MGQESGKPAWPKPTGGYQTITGRRYGRRHAYVSFRPSLNSQDGNQHQHNGGYEGLELSDVQEQISLCMYIYLCVCVPFYCKLWCVGVGVGRHIGKCRKGNIHIST